MRMIMGKSKLENISKVIGEQAYQMLKDYMKTNKTGKVKIEYEHGSVELELLDGWIRYKMV